MNEFYEPLQGAHSGAWSYEYYKGGLQGRGTVNDDYSPHSSVVNSSRTPSGSDFPNKPNSNKPVFMFLLGVTGLAVVVPLLQLLEARNPYDDGIVEGTGYGCDLPCEGGDVRYVLEATVASYDFPTYGEYGDNITLVTRTFQAVRWDGPTSPFCEIMNGYDGTTGPLGPCLQVLPGQQISIKLINNMDKGKATFGDQRATVEQFWELVSDMDGAGANLPQDDLTNWYGSVPSSPSGMAYLPDAIPGMESYVSFDDTNLHFHGLNVMPHLFYPQGTSNPSAPWVTTKPRSEDPDQQCMCYKLTLPEDHPQGLYWYHTHRHGVSSIQGWEGMFGFIQVGSSTNKGAPLYELLQQIDEDDLVTYPMAIWENEFVSHSNGNGRRRLSEQGQQHQHQRQPQQEHDPRQDRSPQWNGGKDSYQQQQPVQQMAEGSLLWPRPKESKETTIQRLHQQEKLQQQPQKQQAETDQADLMTELVRGLGKTAKTTTTAKISKTTVAGEAAQVLSQHARMQQQHRQQQGQQRQEQLQQLSAEPQPQLQQKPLWPTAQSYSLHPTGPQQAAPRDGASDHGGEQATHDAQSPSRARSQHVEQEHAPGSRRASRARRHARAHAKHKGVTMISPEEHAELLREEKARLVLRNKETGVLAQGQPVRFAGTFMQMEGYNYPYATALYSINNMYKGSMSVETYQVLYIPLLCAEATSGAVIYFLDSDDRPVKFYVFGSDGISYDRTYYRTMLVMGTAQRENVLIAFNQAGTYRMFFGPVDDWQMYPAGGLYVGLSLKNQDDVGGGATQQDGNGQQDDNGQGYQGQSGDDKGGEEDNGDMEGDDDMDNDGDMQENNDDMDERDVQDKTGRPEAAGE
eukprot:g2569.t1